MSACPTCKWSLDAAGHCPVCFAAYLSKNRIDRLVADGIDIVSDEGPGGVADTGARIMLARVVRRLGLRAVLDAIREGAETIHELADDPDTSVEASGPEKVAIAMVENAAAQAAERMPA